MTKNLLCVCVSYMQFIHGVCTILLAEIFLNQLKQHKICIILIIFRHLGCLILLIIQQK